MQFIGMLFDLVIKDPVTNFHPIAIIGKFISYIDNKINKRSYFNGFILAAIVIVTVQIITTFILFLFKIKILYYILANIIVFFMLCSKTLYFESNRIFINLRDSNISDARRNLSGIVGRDTKNLSKKEIIKATIETISENTIDGLIAPIFFMIIGLFFNLSINLLVFYKTVNTLDSMVGYKNDKYFKVGYFSAKLDDLLNYIPARLGALIILISGLLLGHNIKDGIKIYSRDKSNHLSPNSAHSEAAVAGLLGIKLGGDNSYFGKVVNKKEIGDEKNNIKEDMIRSTNRIMYLTYINMIIIYIIFERGLL